VKTPVDVAVVGSGAAGIAAAVSSARQGLTTLLLDERASAGGTGGFSGLTTLCGSYDDQGRMLNEGFAREFVERLAETEPVQMGRVWVLPYRPLRFRDLADSLLDDTEHLQTNWNSPLQNAQVEKDTIRSLNGAAVSAVIDCTGTAEVARRVGIECLETTSATQAEAIVFPLCNVNRSLSSPAAMSQVLLPLARAGMPSLVFQQSLEANTVTVKFNGSADRVPETIAFLRANVAGFEHCATPVSDFIPARRAGRMIPGEYVLTGSDVLAGRKFPDAVARCAWPIEQWNSEGHVRLRYVPEGEFYEIPARSLRSASIKNLFMAGKTISADVDAIASARVMGCCLATGAAAGNLAAEWLKSQRRT
jgi:hypothetical protein